MAWDKDYFWEGGEVADTSVEVVEKLLKEFSLKNFQILKGMFPDDTGHHLVNKKFGYVILMFINQLRILLIEFGENLKLVA